MCLAQGIAVPHNLCQSQNSAEFLKCNLTKQAPGLIVFINWKKRQQYFYLLNLSDFSLKSPLWLHWQPSHAGPVSAVTGQRYWLFVLQSKMVAYSGGKYIRCHRHPYLLEFGVFPVSSLLWLRRQPRHAEPVPAVTGQRYRSFAPRRRSDVNLPPIPPIFGSAI